MSYPIDSGIDGRWMWKAEWPLDRAISLAAWHSALRFLVRLLSRGASGIRITASFLKRNQVILPGEERG